jgi:hypothetical protein
MPYFLSVHHIVSTQSELVGTSGGPHLTGRHIMSNYIPRLGLEAISRGLILISSNEYAVDMHLWIEVKAFTSVVRSFRYVIP